MSDMKTEVFGTKLFRDLNEDEVADFKQWARDNYELGTDISSIWHPVCQEECRLMNEEK
jgi:hypothetical protein